MKAAQVLSGLRWMSVATAINFVAQFVFLGILARLLDPAAFGLVAMSSIALRFASFFSQLGVIQALIQKPSLEKTDASAGLLLAGGVSLALCAVMWLAAPLFAAYFGTDELTGLIRLAAASLVISALSGVPVALLRRQARFGAVAFTEVTAYLFGYGAVGVACAKAGLGAWSLVWAGLAQSGLVCLLAMAIARPSLTWQVDRASLRHFFGHGSRYSLIGFLEFLGANIETLYLGRFFGKHDLGVFNRSQMLTNLPVEQAVGTVGKVLFPALSAIQQDVAKRADVFLALLLCIGAFSTCAAMGIAAAAPEIVAVVLGDRWHEAVDVLRIIAFAVPALFMYFVCGIALDSVAALNVKLRLQTLAIVAKLALIFALSGHGLMGVVVAVVLGEYFRLALGMHACVRVFGVGARQVLGIVAVSLANGWIVFVVVHLARRLGQWQGWPVAGLVGAEIAAGLLAMLLAGRLFTRQLGTLPAAQRIDVLRRLRFHLHRVYRLHPAGA